MPLLQVVYNTLVHLIFPPWDALATEILWDSFVNASRSGGVDVVLSVNRISDLLRNWNGKGKVLGLQRTSLQSNVHSTDKMNAYW